jgi:hypothetical protein
VIYRTYAPGAEQVIFCTFVMVLQVDQKILHGGKDIQTSVLPL